MRRLVSSLFSPGVGWSVSLDLGIQNIDLGSRVRTAVRTTSRG